MMWERMKNGCFARYISMEADTESLRSSAPQWSLAGDKQLLGVLQNIHERLVTRCQETNRRLGEMAAALDDASIDLQNVNNKFMALSNSQFIESRVYDDDADVAAPAEPSKEPPKVEVISEVEKIKIGLKVLEDMHEPLQIMDSDSESDSEEEISRMVLKPKDLYADRPLPYIIGSYAWQSKWHAGLLPEDSDTDSSVKRESWEREEYSESDTEISKPTKDQESISSSEDFGSEQVTPSQSVPSAPKSQASVANELARRLRGELPEPELQPEEEYAAPTTAAKKVYRPEKPAPSNIFLDEPPPLEQAYQSSDEDDIFAELRKNQPYSQSAKMQSSVTDELFGEKQDKDDIFSDFREPPPPVNQKSTLFSEESEPELFADQPPTLPKQETATESTVKKPIGGVSLFGNKGTESIGAAILKRNQRQSSSEEELSDDTSQKDKEKDIFDHLFAKSEQEQRKNERKIEKETIKEPIKEVKVDKKVDLFSDNLFDDIDDIFTSNIPKVPIKTAEKNQKSLFDDDDDLFSNVAVAINSNDAKDSKKNIFNSNDDLFSDNVEKEIPSKDTDNKDKMREVKKEITVKTNNKKSIFDSDDELFPNKPNPPEIHTSEAKQSKKENKLDRQSVKEEENKQEKCQSLKDCSDVAKRNTKTKSLFDDSDSDIFSDNAGSKTKEISVNSVVKEKTNVDGRDKSKKYKNGVEKIIETIIPVKDTKKHSLFDDDEVDLFNTKSIKDVKKNMDEITKETPSVLPKIGEKQITSVFGDEPKLENVGDETLFTTKEKKCEKPNKSIFDDDSEDELFSDKPKQIAIQKDDKISIEAKSKSIFNDNDNLFKDNISKTSKEDTLKNEIQEEILEEIKDDIKSKKETVIPELKDDLSLEQNKQDKKESEKSSEGVNPIESSIFDDEDDIFKDTNKDKVTSKDKIESNEISPIFDNVEDDLFLNTSKNVKNVNKAIETNIPQKTEQLPEATKFEVQIQKDEYEIKGNNQDIEKPPVLQDKSPVFDKPDIFSDIFTEPPKFEKPKEPKKSKNVNALFDDDSDDEALFFKKNDPTLDEKPQFETLPIENRLFGIFQDEPPALDIDFVQKCNVKSKENISVSTKSEMFDEKPLFVDSSVSKDHIDSNITRNSTLVAEKEDVKLLVSPEKDITKPKKYSDKTDNATKPIGKLKTTNFNINVNALMPGVSPKKVKSPEQTDGKIQTKSSEDIRIKNTQEVKPQMVKSISFEGKPESQVLDNKLSKERAKIQVKRRPSTRRARKEAVRKSGIDFGDDSTDNSSSIDDQPKYKTENVLADKIKIDVDEPTRSDDSKVVSQSSANDSDRNKVDKKISTTTETKELRSENEENIFDTIDLDKETPDNSKETKPKTLEASAILAKDEFLDNESQIKPEEIAPRNITLQKPDVTTKTVYILNDEDIFNIEKSKVLNIVDDDNPGISTLGKVYTEPKITSFSDSDDELFKSRNTVSTSNETDTNSKSINDDTIDSDDLFKTKTESKKINVFDEDDKTVDRNKFEKKSESNKVTVFHNKEKPVDENLFKRNTIDKNDDKKESTVDEKVSKSEKTEVKKDKISIFDLSDDEDLFSNNKSSEVFKKEVKKVDVKASLFGDEDDNDLFGGSNKKTVDAPSSSQPARAKEVITKSSEPVFEDPLSLLGGDDD